MANEEPSELRTRLRPRLAFLTVLVVIAGVLAVALLRPRESAHDRSIGVSPTEVARTNLVLHDNRLHLPGQAAPYTGTVIEHYPDGSLRSRSVVSNGLLDGLSQGWHPNGQLQVSEHFVAGTSHGLRTKWYSSGAKLSEATIADGKLHGPFRRWHENGRLSEEVEFTDGQPDGVSRAWFPSGYLKARVVAHSGEPIERLSWSDGEYAP